MVNQTYEELNNHNNSIAAINIGEDGMWDFYLNSLTFGNPGASAYCFRAVKSNGNLLDTYTQIAEVTTPDVDLEQSAYRFYANADSADVGAVLAAQDTAATS